MILKDGVSLVGLKLEMRRVMIQAGFIWGRKGQSCVITSGTEGEHSDESLHPFGYALDFRARYFNPEVKHTVVLELQAKLGLDYDVIEESDHIHVEYDKILRG